MKFTSLTQRFAVWFTLVSLLPIILIGNVALRAFETEIKKVEIQNLSAIADKKIEQIDTYLKERELDASLLHDASSTREAMLKIPAVFEAQGVDSEAYRQLDAKYRNHFKRFVEDASYYDLFLISVKGDIVYTQSHESDFATNLFTGPYRDTGLGKVTRHALKYQESAISDFEFYEPSHGAIAAFIAYPIVIDEEIKGVLALQIYSEHVFAVVSNNIGLGETGETVVARMEDEQRALIMAPLKYDPEATLKRKIPLNTPYALAIKKALAGESGGAITQDYRGKEVLAVWRYLPRMNWGIVVKIDAEEAFANVNQTRLAGLIILGITLLGVFFGAYWFNRRVVMPVKNLNASTLDFAAGNLQRRVPIEGWDEIGQLAKTFNDTAEQLAISIQKREKAEKELRQLNQELENRVAARTAELERANEVLASKEEETRSVVEHMVDCVVTTDERGIILSANPVMEKLFGYSPKEAIGQDIAIIVPEPDRSMHQYYMERYCRTGQGQEYVGRPYVKGSHGVGRGREVTAVHKNGELIPVYLAVSEYFVGGKRRFTGIMRDMREHVRIMKELEQARNEAEQANKAKSAFLAAMSHEIRTPMNGIVGMIDMLRQTSLTGYQVEMADLIRDSAYDLLSIIEDILDFSKIEAGKLEIEQAPMSLSNVIEKACGVLEQLAIRKNIELTLFTDPAIPPKVLGDATRMRQVLINIAGNAIKFSSGLERPGQVSLRAILAKSDAEQILVKFQVIDNGIGMDEETQKRIFTSFSQADSSTTRRFGGTGLGLAISRQLVKLMGGEITVQSAPDQGSTFTITLPFKPAPSSEKEAAPPFDLKGIHCLVLGKNKGLSDDLAVYLQSAGADIVQVPDLVAAREKLKKQLANLWIVVIDADHEPLPMDEIRAAFSLRSLEEGRSKKEIAKTESQPPLKGPRFVIIKRGRRRRERIEDTDIITLDGDIMYRENFLHAVAVAAGKITQKEEKPVAGRFEKAPTPPSREEALRQGQLILVAEDNEINQKVIRQQLTLLGYAADMAVDGQDALERLQQNDYALLLTDIHMPNMDGYQLTKAVRSGKTKRKNIPIIALTANALKGEMEHCRSVGMDDYLSKPVQLEDLQNTLAKYLKKSKAKITPTSAQEKAPLKEMPVDITVLKELVGEDADMINELLQEYRDNAAKLTNELHAAFKAGKLADVGAIAHKLKSSSRSVGAMQLGELCAELEQAGKANDAKTVEMLMPKFDEAMAKVAAFLNNNSSTSVAIKEKTDENP